MRLYLIRHGESEANVDWEILKTIRDELVELTDLGHVHALDAGLYLKKLFSSENQRPLNFLVSPWVRAEQTFHVINGVLGGKEDPVFMNSITEHRMNLVNHEENWKKFESYKNREFNVKEYLDVQYEGGESLAEVRKRAEEFLKDIRSGFHGSSAVVVSHGQFLKQVISMVKGKEPDEIEHPKNGEVIVLDVEEI